MPSAHWAAGRIALASPGAAVSPQGACGCIAGGVLGIGFIIVITILGAIREILGNGTVTLFNTELVNLGAHYQPALLFIMPPGGFLTIGFLMALKKKYWKAA